MAISTCPFFTTTEMLGRKYTLELVELLSLQENMSFNGISRTIRNIRSKILSKRLKELEEQNIVVKIHFSPDKISYHLTEKGKELQDIIHNLKLWHFKHHQNLPCLTVSCIGCSYYGANHNSHL
jgi:DNA-binding HxlR family transcriptional regulator